MRPPITCCLIAALLVACQHEEGAVCSDGWCTDGQLVGWDWRDRPAFLATWGSHQDDIWVVGDFGWIVHGRGGEWDFETSFTARPYYAVWGSAPDDVWFAGNRGLVSRFDGSEVKKVGSRERLDVDSILAFAPDDVWATAGLEQVLRWNGQSWLRIGGPKSNQRRYLGGTSSKDVWVVGNGNVERWDGSKLTELLQREKTYLTGVWAPRPGEAWIVGFELEPPGNPIVMRFDEAGFHEVELPFAVAPRHIAGHGEDVWILASGRLFHRYGETWLEEGGFVPLRALWVGAADDIWVAGEQGRAYHFDGSSWTAHETGLEVTIRAIWKSPEGTVWVGGEHSRIARLVQRRWTRVPFVRWDHGGHTWRHEYDELEGEHVTAIGGATGEEVWIGDLRWDGRALEEYGRGVYGLDRYGLWGAAPDDLWMTGDAGALYRYDGLGWSLWKSGTDAPLYRVAGSGPDDAWAVGDRGTALRWDGERWAAHPTGFGGWLRGVWVDSDHRAWLVGQGGAVFVYDGTKVERIAFPTGEDLYDVIRAADGTLYVAGAGGALYARAAGGWTKVPFPKKLPIFDLHQSADGALWASGGGPGRGTGFIAYALKERQ